MTMTGDEGMGWRLGYRPELDGLRAIAVVLVMFSHAKVAGFTRGGVVGVGAFFTLSGFLITALLLEERERDGRVALGAFWRRRFVRLVPALVLMVAVFMALPLTPTRPDLASVAGILLYVGNWVRMAGGIEPFNHTWSLAVEEQFYIVWPLALMVLTRRCALRRAAAIVVALAAGSALLRVVLWVTTDDPAHRIYFGTDTNALSVLAGCALAMFLIAGRRVRVSGGAAVGAAVTLLALAAYPGSDRHVYLVLPLLAAVLVVVVMARLMGGCAPLTWSPLVAIGRLSYGLYLWHVPIIAAWEWKVGPVRGDLVPTASVFALSGGCAYVSWVLVERPLMARLRVKRQPATIAA